jgi:hypothetical protein
LWGQLLYFRRFSSIRQTRPSSGTVHRPSGV